MDSSPATATHHFLNLTSPPLQPSSVVISGPDDFNESDVFWTADFAQSDNPPFRSSKAGVLAALSDDAEFDRKNRIGTIVTRESSQSIPIPRRIEKDCRKFQQSAPISVPRAMTKQRDHREILVAEEEEEEEEEMLPPHEIAKRGWGVSPNTTFSVLEGVGRTLKGRDLRRVRNAVWHTTGFID